jgi:hypothetical protein
VLGDWLWKRRSALIVGLRGELPNLPHFGSCRLPAASCCIGCLAIQEHPLRKKRLAPYWKRRQGPTTVILPAIARFV